MFKWPIPLFGDCAIHVRIYTVMLPKHLCYFQQKHDIILSYVPWTVTFAELDLMTSSSSPGNCNSAVQTYW